MRKADRGGPSRGMGEKKCRMGSFSNGAIDLVRGHQISSFRAHYTPVLSLPRPVSLFLSAARPPYLRSLLLR
jgi:hypothetical protein